MAVGKENRHDFAFLAGVVIGAITGAVGTLAMTPMTGTEARERVRDRMREVDVDELKGRARSAAETGRSKAQGMAQSPGAQGMVAKAKSTVSGAVNRSPLPVEMMPDEAESSAEKAPGAVPADDEQTDSTKPPVT